MNDILISDVAGYIPGVNQLALTRLGLGWNRVDGKLYGLTIVGAVKTVVQIGGGGTTSDHARLHSMTSGADHAAAAEADRDKLVGTNATTGAIEYVSKTILQTIHIPKLKIDTGRYQLYGDPRKIADELRCYFESPDLLFMNLSPQIWLFRKRASQRRQYVSDTVGAVSVLQQDPVFFNVYEGYWTLDAGAAITGADKLVFTDADANAGAHHMYGSSETVTRYAYYQVQITLANVSAGGVQVQIGDQVSPVYNTNGTHTWRTQYLKSAATEHAIHVFASDFGTSLEVTDMQLKRITRNFNTHKTNKWKHEPHLNGTNYPGSSFFGGAINCPIEAIATSGRHTEFTLPSGTKNFGKVVVGLDPYEYIYAKDFDGTQLQLSETFDFSGENIESIEAFGRPPKNASIGFRLAIAVTNPLRPLGTEPLRICGPLSDEFWLRANGKKYSNGLTGITSISDLYITYRHNLIEKRF